jgi:hypothetical protein
MPLVGLLVIIQIAFAIHVVKTGREIYWIFIIVFIPIIGIALYFFTQILPELGQSRSAHKAKNSLLKAIDPKRELRKKKQRLELANTLENKLKLADECLEANMTEDAIDLYQASLKGVGEGDPDILVKLAYAYFKNRDFELTIKTLDDVIMMTPNYSSADGHLLYARSLEKLKKYDEALAEYAVVAENYPGEEGRVRYGLLLKQLGKTQRANEVFKQSINRSKLSPKFYQKKEKYWIRLAKSNMQ